MENKPRRLAKSRLGLKARPPWPEVYLEGGNSNVVVVLKKT